MADRPFVLQETGISTLISQHLQMAALSEPATKDLGLDLTNQFLGFVTRDYSTLLRHIGSVDYLEPPDCCITRRLMLAVAGLHNNFFPSF
jgi:hypothetical protein